MDDPGADDSHIGESPNRRSRDTPIASNQPSIEEIYEIPLCGEWPVAFSRIDAVYIWTQGGYQVSRSPDDYPIFLAVREQDRVQWEEFFEDMDLSTADKRQPREALSEPIQIVLETRSELEIDYVEGYPVVPLGETVAYMQEHYAHFQPALSMLKRMYDDPDLDAVK